MMLAMKYFLKTSENRKGYYLFQVILFLIIVASVTFYNFNINNLFILLSIGLIYYYYFTGSMRRTIGFINNRNQLLLMPIKRSTVYDSIYILDLLIIIFLLIFSLIISIILNLLFKGNFAVPRLIDFYVIFTNISFLLVIQPIFTIGELERHDSKIFIFGGILIILFIFPKLTRVLTSDTVDVSLLGSTEMSYIRKSVLKRIRTIISTYLLGKYIFVRKDLAN